MKLSDITILKDLETKDYRPSTNKKLKINLSQIMLASWWSSAATKEEIDKTRSEAQHYLDTLQECVYCGRPYDCHISAKILTPQNVPVTVCDKCRDFIRRNGTWRLLNE
jgi:hypothetical protein